MIYKQLPRQPRFVHVAASEDDIHAVDDTGRIWTYIPVQLGISKQPSKFGWVQLNHEFYEEDTDGTNG
ncbi:MAG: hypothetical protein ACREJN_21495 [Nitrospiraceae bacterium]